MPWTKRPTWRCYRRLKRCVLRSLLCGCWIGQQVRKKPGDGDVKNKVVTYEDMVLWPSWPRNDFERALGLEGLLGMKTGFGEHPVINICLGLKRCELNTNAKICYCKVRPLFSQVLSEMTEYAPVSDSNSDYMDCNPDEDKVAGNIWSTLIEAGVSIATEIRKALHVRGNLVQNRNNRTLHRSESRGEDGSSDPVARLLDFDLDGPMEPRRLIPPPPPPPLVVRYVDQVPGAVHDNDYNVAVEMSNNAINHVVAPVRAEHMDLQGPLSKVRHHRKDRWGRQRHQADQGFLHPVASEISFSDTEGRLQYESTYQQCSGLHSVDSNPSDADVRLAHSMGSDLDLDLTELFNPEEGDQDPIHLIPDINELRRQIMVQLEEELGLLRWMEE